MPTTLSTIEAKEKLTELIDLVVHSKERIIITRRGKEIAALVPFEDLSLLQEAQDKHDLQEATDALKEARSTGVRTLEELIIDMDRT